MYGLIELLPDEAFFLCIDVIFVYITNTRCATQKFEEFEHHASKTSVM